MCLSNVKSSVLFFDALLGALVAWQKLYRLMYNEHDTGNMVAERRTYIHFYT